MSSSPGSASPANRTRRKARLERVLTASWQSYCRHFIKTDGQVIIPEEGGGTISEAQAYALLRAVWANDAAGLQPGLCLDL